MRKFFLPILLIGSLMAHAQKQKPPLNYKAAFSFSPLALAQIDYTLMFGGEYRLRPGITLVTDIGYIFGSEYMKGEAKPAVGFVFRPSVKLFVNERNNFYLQPQLFYKQVTHQEYDWLGMECVNGIPTYEALTHFRYRRVVYGVNATAGVVLPRAKTGDGLTVEFYFGFGVRFKHANVAGIKRACYQGESIMGDMDNTEGGAFPSVPLGLKLLYLIH